jgi:hypothetical protein
VLAYPAGGTITITVPCSLTSLIITHWTSSHCVASRAAKLTLTIHQFRRDATLQRFDSLEVQTDADDGDGFRSLGKGGNPATLVSS